MAEMANWRRHTVEFKRQVVERMKTCENIHALARELKIERKLLYTWKYQFEGRPEPRHANLAKTVEQRKDKQLREEIAKLKSALADKTLENDFFRSASLRIQAGRRQSIEPGASASTTPSGRGRQSKAISA
jgi:transposase-like protein